MRVILLAIAAIAFTGNCLAAEFVKGATLEVKPNLIWFQDAGELAQWQSLKKSGDAAALAAYQDARGKIKLSRETLQRAMIAAQKSGLNEFAANSAGLSATREAFHGFSESAKQKAAESAYELLKREIADRAEAAAAADAEPETEPDED